MPDQQTAVEVIIAIGQSILKCLAWPRYELSLSRPMPATSRLTSYFTPHKNIIARRKANNG